MARNHKSFVNLLTFKRIQDYSAGITQSALAQAIQVSRKSINAIENGSTIPSTVVALKIATVLNCNVEDLFKLHDGTFPLLTESKKYD